MPIGRRRSRKAKPVEGGESTLPAAYTVAVALLSRRDFSSTELRARLEGRGFERSEVDAVLAELIEEHVLDDVRFATHYVSRHAERGQGPVRLTADLSARGVPASLIAAALESGPEWRALASQVRARRFGPEIPQSRAERSRQARFLRYRGFSWDDIHSVLGADLEPEG